MTLNFKIIRKIAVLAFFPIVILGSCGSGGSTPNPPSEPKDIIPTNLTLTIDVVGVDANHPNGDGSGVIHLTASATNATSYGFRFGNGSEVSSTSGQLVHTYTISGTNNYTVFVYAYSSTGNSINVSKDITVTVTPASFSTLVFSDEFDAAGTPINSKWTYDLGTGSNGWGNNESQYYTNRADNVIVEGGFLKITAKKENFSGAQYTSARLKTQGLFAFKYGKVEVRAKLPAGGGTWPAIWMLGSNITSVGWPASGEIDIMEHIGNDLGKIHGSIHTPSSFGATQNTATKMISDASTAFHIYGLQWTSEKIDFMIDNVVFYTYNPATKNNNNWPFDANQFIILNVAMGGNFGGSIDPNFTQATMEIDYVRVYQ
ncbi:MAG: hypothetical protein COS42_07215 [Flavobacteriales bacterium CG03_land_8_20_14_0_80_35_15]|nr:MAG: hypothetical protein COS42_07215 [Flavobacteriales bacterium CG03_land_8_20_14_0_80_35_15]